MLERLKEQSKNDTKDLEQARLLDQADPVSFGSDRARLKHLEISAKWEKNYNQVIKPMIDTARKEENYGELVKILESASQIVLHDKSRAKALSELQKFPSPAQIKHNAEKFCKQLINGNGKMTPEEETQFKNFTKGKDPLCLKLFEKMLMNGLKQANNLQQIIDQKPAPLQWLERDKGFLSKKDTPQIAELKEAAIKRASAPASPKANNTVVQAKPKEQPTTFIGPDGLERKIQTRKMSAISDAGRAAIYGQERKAADQSKINELNNRHNKQQPESPHSTIARKR